MYRRCWIIFAAMALLSPLGLLAEGTAWGEWSAEDLKELLGYSPHGIERAEEWWQALFPDYSVRFLGEGNLAEMGGYILSAVIGSALVYALTLVLMKAAGFAKNAGPKRCE